jgi:SAM-dependent methyltransferase
MDTNKDRQRAIYNKYSAEYERSVSYIHRMLKPYTIDMWKYDCIDKDVLEIGCGNAYVFRQFHLSLVPFKSYTGIDISEEMIKRNVETYRGIQNVSFFVEDAETLDNIDNERFDTVISYGCLHHLDHPERAVKNVYRKLRAKGLFISVELNRQHPAASFLGLYSSMLRLDPEKTRSAIKKFLNVLVRSLKNKPRQDPYIENHPGHPGKRTPVEYREMLQNSGFHDMKTYCLYLDLFPYFLYRNNRFIFRSMVAMSRPLLRLECLQDVGSTILIQARK